VEQSVDPRSRQRAKVFCIGLNKTATSSLNEALGALGFRTLHWGGPKVRDAIDRAIDEDRPLLDFVEGDYDVFSDIQVLSDNFDLLDHFYPGSKFILNTRDFDQWLDSRRRHVERNIADKELGRYDGQFLEVDLRGWRRQFHKHHRRVLHFFASRPDDLLVIDVTAGDGYDLLCPFLGVAVPDTPFPWCHRDGLVTSGVRTVRRAR